MVAQVVPSPLGVPPPARHSITVTSRHVPFPRQQACVQVLLAQSVLGPFANPPAVVHLAGRLSTHDPSERQQARQSRSGGENTLDRAAKVRKPDGGLATLSATALRMELAPG